MIFINLVVVATIGLIVGSFLSAYTYRLPRKKSTLLGRSICPKCNTKINWFDNIPLISFILLKGKCRNCNKKISIRYPLIEFSTASIFAFSYLLIGNCNSTMFWGAACYWNNILGWLSLPYLLIILSLLVAIFVIDLENQFIPDNLVFVLLVITVVTLILFSPEQFFLRILTGFGVSLFLLIIHLATLGKGMGLGDVKLALIGGMILGWPITISWMFLSFVIGGVVGVILIALGKASFGKQIPFGPFLVIGLIMTLIWGDILGIGSLLV